MAGAAMLVTTAAAEVTASTGPTTQPTIRIGSGSVESGAVVRIPVILDNHRGFTALQFDITFEPDRFEDLDTSECLSQLSDRTFLAGCARQPAPNDDVVRYLILRPDFRPIDSGVLGHLSFRAPSDAPSGTSPVGALECTGLGLTGGQEPFDLTTGDYQPGEIVILGGEPYVGPTAATTLVELDGTPLANDNPVFRRRLAIPNPIPVLGTGPTDIVIALPGGREIEAGRKGFIPREGYVERLDCSGDQVPDGDPDTPVSFRWYGELPNGGWLGLTVVDDLARGTLVTDEASYQISGSPDDGYWLAEIDPSNLPPTDADVFGQTGSRITSSRREHSNAKFQAGLDSVTEGSGPVELDLLIMYTAQAEIDAGGPAGLDALIQQAIDNTNQAFINSGFPDLSVREIHRELLLGFVPSGSTQPDAIADLDLLRVNTQILVERDTHHADVTTVLLRDVGPPNMRELGACGVAYLQSPTCGRPGEFPECGVGVDFEEFAISWVSVECANLPGRNTFPHELGHLMGAEHQPGGPPVSQLPGDASFVWSFAHFRLSAAPFGTLMWAPTNLTGELPQPLNFSNPDVSIQSQPSGIVNERDNIRTFELLTPIMEQFRTPPSEVIFEDGFE